MVKRKTVKTDANGNLSKRNSAKLASMLSQMDKDTAIAFLNQFPNYSQTATSLVNHLSEVCISVANDNSSSMKYVAETYKIVLESLAETLKRDDLSSEERMYISEQMVEVADKFAKKDTENKNFLIIIITICAGFGAIALAPIAALFGINLAKNNQA